MHIRFIHPTLLLWCFCVLPFLTLAYLSLKHMFDNEGIWTDSNPWIIRCRLAELSTTTCWCRHLENLVCRTYSRSQNVAITTVQFIHSWHHTRIRAKSLHCRVDWPSATPSASSTRFSNLQYRLFRRRSIFKGKKEQKSAALKIRHGHGCGFSKNKNDRQEAISMYPTEYANPQAASAKKRAPVCGTDDLGTTKRKSRTTMASLTVSKGFIASSEIFFQSILMYPYDDAVCNATNPVPIMTAATLPAFLRAYPLQNPMMDPKLTCAARGLSLSMADAMGSLPSLFSTMVTMTMLRAITARELENKGCYNGGFGMCIGRQKPRLLRFRVLFRA